MLLTFRPNASGNLSKFKSSTNDFGWHMIGVSAPNCNQERQEVCREIRVEKFVYGTVG